MLHVQHYDRLQSNASRGAEVPRRDAALRAGPSPPPRCTRHWYVSIMVCSVTLYSDMRAEADGVEDASICCTHSTICKDTATATTR